MTTSRSFTVIGVVLAIPVVVLLTVWNGGWAIGQSKPAQPPAPVPGQSQPAKRKPVAEQFPYIGCLSLKTGRSYDVVLPGKNSPKCQEGDLPARFRGAAGFTLDLSGLPLKPDLTSCGIVQPCPTTIRFGIPRSNVWVALTSADQGAEGITITRTHVLNPGTRPVTVHCLPFFNDGRYLAGLGSRLVISPGRSVGWCGVPDAGWAILVSDRPILVVANSGGGVVSSSPSGFFGVSASSPDVIRNIEKAFPIDCVDPAWVEFVCFVANAFTRPVWIGQSGNPPHRVWVAPHYESGREKSRPREGQNDWMTAVVLNASGVPARVGCLFFDYYGAISVDRATTITVEPGSIYYCGAYRYWGWMAIISDKPVLPWLSFFGFNWQHSGDIWFRDEVMTDQYDLYPIDCSQPQGVEFVCQFDKSASRGGK